MSRSYHKTPVCNYVKPDGKAKRRHNRRFRRRAPLDFPSGDAYRKVSESWDIHDCRVVGTSYERFREDAVRRGRYVDEQSCRQEYERWYRRK